MTQAPAKLKICSTVPRAVGPSTKAQSSMSSSEYSGW
jgi:hypothetical protein